MNHAKVPAKFDQMFFHVMLAGPVEIVCLGRMNFC